MLMESSWGTSRGLVAVEDPEVNTTTPKEHHQILLSQMFTGERCNLLGAGGRSQDALLFANENLSLSSQLQRA